MRKIDRTGEVAENVDGLAMEIVEYIDCKNVWVRFKHNGSLRKTTYLKFKRGKVYPTWRNKELTAQSAESVVMESDNQNEDYEMHAISTAVACAISIGLTFVGFGVVGGIFYAILQLCKYLS